MAKQIKVTVSDHVARQLQVRAEAEGRTVANLMSYLTERTLEGEVLPESGYGRILSEIPDEVIAQYLSEDR